CSPSEDPLAADMSRLAGVLHPDAVQLSCSVAVHSGGELSLAPDEYAGFVRACLRMLALNGQAGPATALQAPAAATPRPEATAATAASPAAPAAPETVAPVAAAPRSEEHTSELQS